MRVPQGCEDRDCGSIKCLSYNHKLTATFIILLFMEACSKCQWDFRLQ